MERTCKEEEEGKNSVAVSLLLIFLNPKERYSQTFQHSLAATAGDESTPMCRHKWLSIICVVFAVPVQ